MIADCNIIKNGLWVATKSKFFSVFDVDADAAVAENYHVELTPTLVIAGEGEDGVLEAWEVFDSVRLDADLVTLSACETAAGNDRAALGLAVDEMTMSVSARWEGISVSAIA